MKKPSKKLLGKAGLLEESKKHTGAIVWALLFNCIEVVGAHFTAIESAEWLNGKRLMDSDDFPAEGSKFNLFLSLCNKENHFADLSVQFFANNKAEADKDVFQGKIPKFLKGNFIFGFKGTWEEMTEKIIEVNGLMGYEFPYEHKVEFPV